MRRTLFSGLPPAQGLYDPAREHDSCGLALVATLRGTAGHDVVRMALEALTNLEHRGAVGADEGTGDGAGITLQLPDAFFRDVCEWELPAAGAYAAGLAFLPAGADARNRIRSRVASLAAEEGLEVLGWRPVPVRAKVPGRLARECMPAFEQLFVTASGLESGIALDRLAFRLRKRAERELELYFASLSCRTVCYKGMLTTLQLGEFYPDLLDERLRSRLALVHSRVSTNTIPDWPQGPPVRHLAHPRPTVCYKGMLTTLQLGEFYPDLLDERLRSRLALVHSRFSTNTFPSWPLAQPFRLIAHNGEINTVQGNRNWMRARQSQLASDLLGDLGPVLPICSDDASDSASFDEVVELLSLAGRSLPHAIMMMVPEAFENADDMDPARRAFYEYHSMLMEPWDGPAAIGFTDGRLIGATLDRNGLRPGRFVVTDDGFVVLASEVGVLDFPARSIVRKGRLRPGRMFLVDTEEGRLIEDDEVKRELAAAEPWEAWLSAGRVNLADLPDREHVIHTSTSVIRRQRTFGYTEEEVRMLLTPMAAGGAEPLGAMGSDTPIAVLAERPRLLFDYFSQAFAQVTNPPLDSIRESLVTSLRSSLGPERNLLAAGPEHAYQIVLDFPVIDNDQLAKIQHIDASPGSVTATTLSGLYRFDAGDGALERRLEEICAEVDSAVEAGAKYLILSDRGSNKDLAPIPSLLLVSAVHHHLLRSENRMRVGLLVEAGDVREVHHVALLLGYGATAVNPYLAMETAEDLVRRGRLPGVSGEDAVRNVITALGKGVQKVMSKMGISVVASYAGAQAFEAIGLDQAFVDRYFTGTTSRLGGVGLEVVAAENLARHRSAYPDEQAATVHEVLPTGGEYQWRREGPPHLFTPETVFRLQHSTRTKRYDVFKQYTSLVDEQAGRLTTLRGMFRLREGVLPPVPIDQVEPVAQIVRRFATGAMSYGSISREAHETLAIAMNRLGGRSNTGEGGEDVERLLDPERRSAIKQVASARFGVTSLYLSEADDIQIKMAQGAKPGEGGQLPPGKVYPWIARTRHATAGVGLISPPPHHDIYSIEDLKQLIFDLKHASPRARIQVKLVSQSGIGAVAVGVTKAKADAVLVSGHDGGTGASPLGSLKHAGTPWELGLAEAQQTLMLNGLRDRVSLQVDGQLKTGRDVVIAALLGAEEFGFATAPLVVSGCVMMRVCHLDTCPVGVATQNPELRSRFTGAPEFVVNFFEFLAEEVRELLAGLGLRSIDEAIGRRELLETDDVIRHWKAEGLDLAPILTGGVFTPDAPRRRLTMQDHELASHGDQELIRLAADALETTAPVVVEVPVRNTDRAIGTLLGHEVTRRYGEQGLAPETIDITLHGTAGQSLGAFLPRGIVLRLEGDANDYVGKGLSGGDIVVRPHRESVFRAERNVIVGNVVGYGATSGSLFIRGIAGERFLVRNSGATAVVEGVGDHALEYMTGGTVLILGPTGRNLGAGMSGGVAYVHRLHEAAVNRQARASGELALLELDRADVELVAALLTQHRERTGSTVAARMLAGFDTVRDEFVKVLPRDYAAVMGARAGAEAEGLDPDGPVVWQRILEVTGG